MVNCHFDTMDIIINSLDMVVLAQSSGGGATTTSFQFDPSNVKALIGGFFGFILLISFVAAAGRIAWEFFVNKNQGGADMEVVYKMVFGIVGLIVFSVIWGTIFGDEFIVDASLESFDQIRSGGGTP